MVGTSPTMTATTADEIMPLYFAYGLNMDVAGMRETRQRHVDRAARTEVDELLGRKHPATALAAHTLHNPIRHRRHVDAPTC